MSQNVIVTVLVFLFSGAFTLAAGQTTGGNLKPSVISGTVVTIANGKIVVNAAA